MRRRIDGPGFGGAFLSGERLAHLLITHTHASNVRGKGWEAALLFYADFVDTDAGIVMAGEGSPMYSQRWKLG